MWKAGIMVDVNKIRVLFNFFYLFSDLNCKGKWSNFENLEKPNLPNCPGFPKQFKFLKSVNN